mmetsp:Transcript_3652/g.5356  ORF Transcript_3652/g.5356 Transcript_3652/m.5356 type:complete len:368 (-) Transcript_3652:137-1240(-)
MAIHMRWSQKIHAATWALRCSGSFSLNIGKSSSRAYYHHAVQVYETGGPEVLTYNPHVPSKTCLEPDEVRVSIQKIGVNYHDTYTRTGLYPSTTLPFVVGCEASGEITEMGTNHKRLKVGDRVAFFHYNCGYATEAVVPQDSCFSLPDDVSYELGAASLVQGLTAHYLAHDSFALQPGSTCLVHAAGGGTGNLLLQMAKLRGATTIATVQNPSGPKAEAVTQAGADYVIAYGDEYDFTKSVQQIIPDGVDVVYDSIGKATAVQSLQCLKPRGTCVLYGNSSGAPDAIFPTPTLAANSLYVQRPVLEHFVITEEERTKRAADLFRWIQEGKLHIRISNTYSLQEASEAHAFLESRKAHGKVLLDPWMD